MTCGIKVGSVAYTFVLKILRAEFIIIHFNSAICTGIKNRDGMPRTSGAYFRDDFFKTGSFKMSGQHITDRSIRITLQKTRQEFFQRCLEDIHL